MVIVSVHGRLIIALLVLLAYAELIANRPMTETELAQAFASRLGENVTFDISDAMTKLNALVGRMPEVDCVAEQDRAMFISLLDLVY